MVRITIIGLLIVFVLTACGGQEAELLPATETPIIPTRTPSPTATPRQLAPTLPPISTRTSTTIPEPTLSPTQETIPDLSGVTLYEVTHLMDPSMFQVSMDGWPANMPEDTIVRVGMNIFTCDVLFPDLFPNRVYCWGKAPASGTEVKIQVILEKVPLPLLEISFRVPYPSDDEN
jgi:hypothetical protein